MLTNTSKQAVRMARGMATGKELTFGLEARAQMLVGVDKLADAVQVRGTAERSCVVGLFALESRVPARNSCCTAGGDFCYVPEFCSAVHLFLPCLC